MLTRVIGKGYDAAMLKTAIFMGVVAVTVLASRSQAAALPESRSGISVLVNTNGDYEVRSREPAWTFGGNVGSPVQGIETATGQDAIGAYREVTFHWAAQFSAGVRSYNDRPAVLFSVDLPAG